MKRLTIVVIAAFALLVGSALTSCSKSNDDLIKEYKELCSEVATAVKEGDAAKIQELSAKGEKLGKELSQRDLTDEQKAEILNITADYMKELSQGTMQQLDF